MAVLPESCQCWGQENRLFLLNLASPLVTLTLMTCRTPTNSDYPRMSAGLLVIFDPTITEEP